MNIYKCVMCDYVTPCYVVEISGELPPPERCCMLPDSDAEWEEVTNSQELIDELQETE
jgi:hypothetical protein